MSNGIASFFDWYAVLPYQWPLAEVLPVVRIPVAGPEPFNTLVVVRAQVGVIDQTRPSDGQTHHARLALGTAFSLVGFDPRIQPAFDYSAAVSLQMLQSSGRTTFICAVDTVSGAFDENGRWTVTVDVASEFDGVLAAASAYVSSWVLCYEPPVDLPRTPGKPRQQGSVRQQTITNIAALAHT
jgi:hypothetical protein